MPRWPTVVFLASALTVAPASVQAQDWGFSTPSGAVVRIVRDPGMNLVGTASLPAEPGQEPITIPLTGRNEPGKLLIEFHDTEASRRQVLTYTKSRWPEEGYAVWRADDAPEPLRELRAPVNVTSDEARRALEAWNGDRHSVLPVETYAELLAHHRDIAAKYAVGAEMYGNEGAGTEVAVVTDRPSVAAWEVALSHQGEGIRSLQTFSGVQDGVVFTARPGDVVAALDSRSDLLRDFGGIGTADRQRTTFVPVRATDTALGFEIPLANLFDSFVVQGHDLSKAEEGLHKFVEEMRQRKIECAYGDPKKAMFAASCLHHCSAHNISGNFLVRTFFTFMVGEQSANLRRVFVIPDSYGASAKVDDGEPGRDRFTYSRSSQRAVQSSHEVAVASLFESLRSMYPGLRRD